MGVASESRGVFHDFGFPLTVIPPQSKQSYLYILITCFPHFHIFEFCGTCFHIHIILVIVSLVALLFAWFLNFLFDVCARKDLNFDLLVFSGGVYIPFPLGSVNFRIIIFTYRISILLTLLKYLSNEKV